MNNYINSIFAPIKERKVQFIFFVIMTVLVIAFGVFAAINFSGAVLSVDLNNIAYITFLKDKCSLVSMIFRMIFSVAIFIFAIILCFSKVWLTPLGFLIYLYLVYSQTAVFVSIILIYGFLNCVILLLFLFIYILLICAIMLLAMLELGIISNDHKYFNLCFNINSSHIVLHLLFLVCATIVFCLILTILKSFVILLVY